MGIGVIGAIVMPAFLSTVMSIVTQAIGYISSMNKGQQASFVEKSVFTSSVKALGIGIKTETTNYKYSLVSHKKKQHLIMESQRKYTLKAMSVVSL